MARERINIAPTGGTSRTAGNTLTETLTGARTISWQEMEDYRYFALDPGGSARTVTLPAEAQSKGAELLIKNTADAAEAITVADDAAATVAVIYRDEAGLFWCDGTTWHGGSLPETGGAQPAGSIGEAEIAAGSLTGLVAATVADDNVIGGIPLVHRISVASGANANTDVTLTHKSRVIDVWFVLSGAGTTGSALSVTDGTNVIVTSIDVSSGGDKDIFRAVEIDNAYHEIAAAGTLRITSASTGGDFPGCEAYALVVRVA